MEGGCLGKQACNGKGILDLEHLLQHGLSSRSSAGQHFGQLPPPHTHTPLDQSNSLCLVLWVSRQDQIKVALDDLMLMTSVQMELKLGYIKY